MTVVDLFAGAGGWDLPARELGTDPVGIELDPDACATRAAVGLPTIRADLDTYRIPTRLDGLIASPPCQDFSLAGKQEGRTGDRGRLIDVVPLWVEHARPRWVACEQVPPCEAIWNEHAAYYRTLGYETWVGVLNAADYGVPQTRRRAILLASLDRRVTRPAATHERDASGMFALVPWISMADALGWNGEDAPARTVAGNRSPRWMHGETNGYRRGRTVETGANTMKHSRDPAEVERYERSCDEPAPTLDAKVGGAWRVNTGMYWKPGGDRDDAQEFDPAVEPARALTGKSGGQWQLREVQDHGATRAEDEPAMPISASADNRNFRWERTRPATTIAGDPRVWPPGHKVNQDDRDLGTDEADARYGDRAGSEAIRLTVADALVLQSFPRDFPVQGTKTAQFRQVGNAIPPLLALRVLEEVIG